MSINLQLSAQVNFLDFTGLIGHFIANILFFIMARSRTPPSSLRRRTLSPEDMSYLSTGASVFNSTLPPQEVGIGEPGPSTRPGRMAGGSAAESMLSYDGARPTLSSSAFIDMFFYPYIQRNVLFYNPLMIYSVSNAHKDASCAPRLQHS